MKSTSDTQIQPDIKAEIKSALSLSGIFAFRMLAIFMFVPIFSVYAQTLSGATPFLIGIAIGIYGLTQAICQLPLGAFSDKLGRKPVIALGLIIFSIGSLIGAFADNITWLILARILQGAGAVGSTLIALLADLTSEKNRTKAMALMGVSMGLSSALAIIAGPAIASHFGLSGVFFTSVLLSIGSIGILYSIVPTPSSHPSHDFIENVSFIHLFKKVLTEPKLLQLDLGIFLLHAIFTALFFVCPLILKNLIHDSAFFYLPIIGVAFLLLFPSIMIAEKKKKMPTAFLISIAILLLSQLSLLFFHKTLGLIGVALSVFFLGFNFLEAALPSLVSKAAPSHMKGTAMSVYSSAQFFGIFIGGTFAGIIYPFGGATGIFIFTSILALFWLLSAVAFKSKLVV